jgi:hypothetical protein
MIEDALRKSVAARVASPPALDDPASPAIRRGRAIRRRRTVGSGAAVLVLFAGLLGGAVVARRGALSGDLATPLAPPAAAPSGLDAAPLAVDDRVSALGSSGTPDGNSARPGRAGLEPDVWVGNAVWTPTGERLALTASRPVTTVYRVPAGWVYAADQVRLLRPDGGSVALVGQPDGWALSADGARFAYVAGGRLTVADLDERGLSVRSSVPVASGVAPVTFVNDRLVITRGGTSFDFMNVGGAYTPTWSDKVLAIYGPRSGNLAGLVQTRSGACLAELAFKPTGLVAVRTGGCRLKLTAARAAQLSPNGDSLAVPGPTGVSLVNLGATFAGDKTVLTPCPGRATPAPTWLSGNTLATLGERGPLRCHTDGSSDPATVPRGVGAGWAYVPRLAEAG